VLSQATIPASNIDGYIDPIMIQGLSLANVALLPADSGYGGVLSCASDTIRIGSCPRVTGGCTLDSSDSSSCSYIGSFAGACPALSMLCG
jgi:hypothetical protein